MTIYHRTFEIGPAIETRRGDAPAKTYRAVLTTGAPLKRRSWFGAFDEVLHLNGVDLTRAPFPLLAAHDTRSMPIGLADNVYADGMDLRGEIVFGPSEKAREIQAGVDAGVIRSLSIGYTHDEVRETKDKNDRLTRIDIVRWTLLEASVVSVPAAPSAGFRGATIHQEREVDAEILAALGLAPNATPEEIAAAVRSLNQRATAADTDRRAELRQSALERGLFTFGSDRERLFNAALERDVGEARALAETWAGSPAVPVGGPGGSWMQSRADRDPDQPIRSSYSRHSSGGRGDDFREAAIDALLLRCGVPVKDPHPAAGDIDASVRGLAAITLSRRGETIAGGDGLELMLRRSFEGMSLRNGIGAQGRDDFSGILEGAMHAALRRGYEDEPQTHRRWVRPVPVSDFREQVRPILGSSPSLEKVLEHAEYEHGPLTDDSTRYVVDKYGRIISLSWEALVNDNLASFVRVIPGLGMAARRLEADLVYTHLESNPEMQDTNDLFDAAHDNLATAGPFDAALLAVGRLLLRKQTALGGGFMSLIPKFLIAPAEREHEAEVLLAAATRHVTTATEAETPKWLANLELVVEPRLADDAVYLAADSAQIDTFELGTMAGHPAFFEEQAFNVDSRAWKARHVVGVKALDWRGLVKLPIQDPDPE